MARILGLDIDRTALRAAVVRTSFRKAEIELYMISPLDQVADESDRALAVREALEGLLQQLDGPPDAVISALDGRHVSLRQVTLPKAAEKRAAEVLPFELESLLPFELDDAVIDYQPVHSDDRSVTLLVAAVLTNHVEAALAELGRADVSPRELCPAPVYLEELSHLAGSGAGQLFIELRQDCTEVAAMEHGRCSMARTLSITFESCRTSPEAFFRAIHQTLVSFRAAGVSAPEQVLLLGEGVEAGSFADWLSERLELPVTEMALPPAASAPAVLPDPSLARALGLARRGLHSGRRLNLRRGRYSPVQGSSQWTRYANLLSACGVALMISVMFSLKARQSLLLDEQLRLQSQLAETTKAVFGKATSTTTAAELLLRGSRSSDPLPRFDALDALFAVSNSISPDIEHEVRRLRIEVGDEKREGHVELQGMLGSIEERDAIAAVLEDHPCFSDIEKGKTSSGRGTESINYQLEAVVQCPSEAGPAKKRRRSRGD